LLYQSQDVISLSDTTPNLDELLKNFQREHHHTDDEVRFIVSGHGSHEDSDCDDPAVFLKRKVVADVLRNWNQISRI
jgi:cupin superfamily acireductone dioxygenase involved in methionine salvage